MQPSNQQGLSERLDRHLEELCWENGQLLEAPPIQNIEGERAAGSSCPKYGSREKDYAMKGVGFNDDRITEAAVYGPGVDITDWLDSSLDPGVMQRNTLPSSVQSYQPVTELKCGEPLPQQIASLRGELESLERLCGPSLQSGLLNSDTRVKRPVDPPVQLTTMMSEDFSRVGDAMLNRISSLCMGPSSIQSLENALFSQSTGDGRALHMPRINQIGKLPGTSNVNSRSSMDVSPSSDLDSVLLDSCGSGFTPNQGSKFGEVLGSKKPRAEDLDSDSEGSFDELAASRKPRQEQGPSNKRIRASETHNESERKRRGRINEKLKALQELIPNANKTDKASVLTEAIDYLKKLRLQLQVMCCRHGLIVSPLMGSQGVQPLQMPHVGAGVNVDRQMGAVLGASAMSGGSQSFPLTSEATVQVCSVPTELQGFNEAPFAAPSTLVSSRGTVAYGPVTNLGRQASFPHPFQV